MGGVFSGAVVNVGGCLAELGKAADAGEVDSGPGPSGGEAEDVTAAVVDQEPGAGEQLGADGLSGGEPLTWWAVAQEVDPSVEVVRQRRAGQPGGIGAEPSGRQMSQPTRVFQVADSKFAHTLIASPP